MSVAQAKTSVIAPKLGERFLHCTKIEDLRKLLSDLGDHDGLKLHEPFGQGFVWHPYGDNEQNYSVIGYAQCPARCLAERLTNSEDAVIQNTIERMDDFSRRRISPDLTNPYTAAEHLFNRPCGGASSDLTRWLTTDPRNMQVALVMLMDKEKSFPTIDIIDAGIGISPEEMPDTILSLHKGNKANKPYLMGSYGQGGSTSLGFCEMALIACRHWKNPERIGLTVTKAFYAEGMQNKCIAYLAVPGPDGKPRVPEFESRKSYSFYQGTVKPGSVMDRWSQGALVRHFHYELNKFGAALGGRSQNNLWHGMDRLLPDPVLAYHIFDLRTRSKKLAELKKNVPQRMSGALNRLRRLSDTERKEDPKKLLSGSAIEYYLKMLVSDGQNDPTLPVEIFVILNHEKGKINSCAQAKYVEGGKPFNFHYNGQMHGSEGKRALSKAGLEKLCDHMVIAVDLGGLGQKERANLLTTTRQDLRDTELKETIIKNIVADIADDPKFQELEEKFANLMFRRTSSDNDKEIEDVIKKMLVEAGLVGPEGTSGEGGNNGPGEGEGEKGGGTKREPGPRGEPEEPIETSPFPRVDDMYIARPAANFKLNLGGYKQVCIETDADSKFDEEGLIKVSLTGPVRCMAVRPLQGGRKKWRLQPKDHAKINDEISVKIEILDPKTFEPLHFDEVKGLIVAPKQAQPTGDKGSGNLGGLPAFSVQSCSPEDEETKEAFHQLFGQYGLAKEDAAFGYAVIKNEGKEEIRAYYCADFGPLSALVNSNKQVIKQNLPKIERDYKAMVGFAAVKEFLTTKNQEMPEMEPDKARILQQRLAQMRSAAAESFVLATKMMTG